MAIISTVANDLATYESERVSWLKRKVWLTAHQKEDDKREGVPRATVERDYLELWKLMMQARKPDADLAEVRSFFDTRQVETLADQEEAALDSIGDATDDRDAESRSKVENQVREKLIKAMGADVRRPGEES